MRWTVWMFGASAFLIAGASTMAWKPETQATLEPLDPPALVTPTPAQPARSFRVEVVDGEGKPVPALITDWTGTEIWEVSKEGLAFVQLEQVAQPLRIAAPGFITETFIPPLTTDETLPSVLQIRLRRNPLLIGDGSQG